MVFDGSICTEDQLVVLFVDQPQCRDRLMCEECRSADSLYRDGWKKIYLMPPTWPACPYGIPPTPIAKEELGVLYQAPASREAQEAMSRVRARASQVRPFCLACEFYHGLTEDGLQVDCEKGRRCCGGTWARGFVHLGAGNCSQDKWQKIKSVPLTVLKG